MDPRQLPPCRLSRRQVICAFVAVTMPIGVARAQGGGAVEFVRDLYVREIEMHLSRKPGSAEAFFALFARDLRVLMQSPRPHVGREPIGRILHAFFGWGVLPGQPVKLIQVIPAPGGNGGLTLVRVDLEHHGATHQIIVRPVREDGLWKIADVSYDSGEDLRTYYRRITGR
jgi:ribosomal protein S28E/S33